MSGICAILHLNGEPVQEALLRDMTDVMKYRGPDLQVVWRRGSVGLGHALLSTIECDRVQAQPCSLDDQVWISADARIDAQAELIAELRSRGRVVAPACSDAELILHAYHAWGADCVRHFIGDFAFVIWDDRNQELFCARDHFGIKPFFYAALGNCLVLGNAIDALRKHPSVSGRLNDLAIADFLMFDANQMPQTTAFADIQRLCGGHVLSWSARQGLRVTRYWELEDQDIRTHQNPADCVEQFASLLESAVKDRLRGNRIGFQLSGGLDSTSVAAVALKVLRQTGQTFSCEAHTMGYRHLIRDPEPELARVVAAYLNVPLVETFGDDYPILEFDGCAFPKTPEPAHLLFPGFQAQVLKTDAAIGRVVLTGWDGDALASESLRPYCKVLMQSGRHWQMMGEVVRYIAHLRGGVVPPRWGNWLRSFTPLSRDRLDSLKNAYPDWLNPDLAQRLALPQRWEHYLAQMANQHAHPLRPYAYGVFRRHWEEFFEKLAPGFTRQQLEYRHPLMDVRLVQFCLSLPVVPWVMKKHIFRQAMRGRLPEVVRRRHKTPVMASPLHEQLKRTSVLPDPMDVGEETLWHYLDRDKLPSLKGLKREPGLAWINARPYSLLNWVA
jgi:asparagine synthase (glutamine-hydrolysing)